MSKIHDTVSETAQHLRTCEAALAEVLAYNNPDKQRARQLIALYGDALLKHHLAVEEAKKP